MIGPLDRLLMRRAQLVGPRDRDRLEDERFTLVSNDCWGAEVYRHLRLSYTTPFVGLFVPAPDYLMMLSDLERWVHAPMRFVERSRYPEYGEPPYPVARLDGEVELHFVHHTDPATAEATWRRRAERMDFDRLVVKLSAAKDRCTDEHVRALDAMDGVGRLCLSPVAMPDVACVRRVRLWSDNGKYLFYRCLLDLDIVAWLNAASRKNAATAGVARV
jgi:uncharacterized protein (DUF1919 family)